MAAISAASGRSFVPYETIKKSNSPNNGVLNIEAHKVIGNERPQASKSLSMGTSDLKSTMKGAANKASQIGQFFFNSLIAAPVRTAFHIGMQQLSDFAAATFLKLGTPSISKLTDVERSIDEITGSSDVTKIFHALAPWLASVAQKKILEMGWGSVMLASLQKKEASLEQVIDIMLPKIFLNVAKYVKEQMLIENQGGSRYVTLVDIIGCLASVIQRHMKDIHENIERVDAIADPVIREKKLRKLFLPLSRELLSIFFPEGKKELPFVGLSRYWPSFEMQNFPDILLQIYRMLTVFNKKTNQTMLSECSDGEVFIKIAASISGSVEAKLPGVFAAQTVDDNVTHSDLVIESGKMFSELLEGDIDQKKHYECWLRTQLSGLGSSKNEGIRVVWKFLSSYAEPILLHLFAHIASVPTSVKSTQETPVVISVKLATVVSRFFNEYHHGIDSRIHELHRLNQPIENDAALLQMFSLFVEDLLQLAGLNKKEDLPVPDFLKDLCFSFLKENASQMVLKQYLVVREHHFSDELCHHKFKDLLFDPYLLQDPYIATSMMALLYRKDAHRSEKMADQFYAELWKKCGTETIFNTIKNICSIFSSEIVDAMGKRLGILQQNELKASVNPFMKAVFCSLKEITESIVINCAVQILDHVPQEISEQYDGHPKSLFGLHFIAHMSHLTGEKLKNIDEVLKKIDEEYVNDPEKRNLEIKKAFMPLASDLHSMIAKNPLESLPLKAGEVGDSIKAMIWNSVKSDVLPEILYENYKALMTWPTQKQKNFDALEDCYQTTHMTWMCRVLAQYAADFIRHYLSHSSQDLAALLLNPMESYFEAAGGQNRFVAEILQENRNLIQEIIGKNIKGIGTSKDPRVEHIWPFVVSYIESALAKCLLEFSLTVRSTEAEDPNLMIDLATRMIKTASSYFHKLNELSRQCEHEYLDESDATTILAGFGLSLHPGVPLDPLASEQEQNEVRLKGWLIPLAFKLMQLAKIKPNDFSLPSSIRKQFGEMFIETILPQVLLGVNKAMIDPQTRDALMLNFVEMLYAALNNVGTPPKEQIPDAKKDASIARKQLNASCGAVVLEIVELIPDSMVQYVFMKEKVKKMSAEIIGDSIMTYFSKWTLLQLIDLTVYNALPNLHPSKWEGKAGKEILVPRRLVSQPGGSLAFTPVKKFKFVFPEKPEDIERQQKERLSKSHQVREQLRDGFTRTISSQVFSNAWGLTKTIWNNSQAQLDAYIAKHLPKYGVAAKSKLDPIFRKIFFDVIGPVVAFMSYPLVQLIKLIVEKIKIDKKSEEIIQNLHSPAMEHLLYSWIDLAVDMLKRKHKHKPSEFKT